MIRDEWDRDDRSDLFEKKRNPTEAEPASDDAMGAEQGRGGVIFELLALNGLDELQNFRA